MNIPPLDDRDVEKESELDSVGWEPCDECLWGYGVVVFKDRTLCIKCYASLVRRNREGIS